MSNETIKQLMAFRESCIACAGNHVVATDIFRAMLIVKIDDFVEERTTVYTYFHVYGYTHTFTFLR